MEVDGFLYEALDPLAASSPTSTATTATITTELPDSDQPEPYTVFRTQIPSLSFNSPSLSTAAPDFFSLNVDDDDDDIEPSTPAPTSPATASTVTQETTVSRTLERGWFRDSRFKSPMLQLHKEIVDFCDFLSPTREEEISRDAAVADVFGVIKYIWPNCKVEVFGSFKTGLYLPTSDIDVVILDSQVRTPQIGLHALSKALSQRGIAKKIQVIAKARVPIVKFIEKGSGIAFDISFDVANGPKAAVFIKDAVTRIPPLRPLCLILKVFLQQRELNEVYSGGIGSYALLAMLIAHLQMHWKGQFIQGNRASLENNLGILLVSFFEFYGRKLNIWDVGISCKGSGAFFLKSNRGFLNRDRPFLLCIEDPQTPENDIGKNSFNYAQIRSAFGMAFSTLTSSKTILGLGPNKSILGTIIRPDAILLERKGGSKGEMTFNSLLPGAGEIVQPQFQNEQEILGNWRFDEEEPLPRGDENLVEDCLPSKRRRKKKFMKEKRNSLLNDSGNGEIVQSSPRENSSLKEKLKSKKRRNINNGLNDNGSSRPKYSRRR